MGDNEGQRFHLATVTLNIIAIAAFATLVCFVTSAALAEEVERSGNNWHRVCACRAQQELHDGLAVGPRPPTSLRRSPINDCWQARGGPHELRQSGNGTGNDVGFDRRKGLGKRGPDARGRLPVPERPSLHVSDTVAAGRLFHAPRWREAR
jgi:hypothetical protein